MPKVTWDDLNKEIHAIKGSLTKLTGIEIDLKNLKKKLIGQLDNMNKIILRQVNNDKNNNSD